MGRKGKTQKHTASEIASKHKAAKEARGGAGAALSARPSCAGESPPPLIYNI